LTPETATTYSAGADYTPHYVPGLKLSVNYFNIDYRNQISGYLSDLSLLSSTARASQFSSLIVSNPAAAQALVAKFVAEGYPVFGVLPNPVTTFVYGENINLGRTEADGFDFSASYRIPTTNYGDFGVGLNGTYFASYKVALTPTSPLMDEDNHIFNPLRLRMRGSVNWADGPIRATAFVNFENSYINDTVTPVQRVSSYTTVDLHIAYDLGQQSPLPYLKGATLTLDVNNLFDTDPPFVNVAESPNGGGGFDPTTTNPIGRLVSLTIDKKF
jgi:iron complex outermembrane receptor protein